MWIKWLYQRMMHPKDPDGMANSVDPDKTAPLGAVWSGSILFAQTCLSENLGPLWYMCIAFWNFYVSDSPLYPYFLRNKHSKESYFRINACWDIINVQRKQQGTKDSTLWNTGQNPDPINFFSHLQQLCITEKNLSISVSSYLSHSQNSLHLRSLWGWGITIKCYFKIQYECINLSSIVQDFSPIIYYSSNLSFTPSP